MSIFAELSLILIVATLIASLMRLLRQPLIMGHILTGLVVGPYVFNLIASRELLETFSDIGVALLLFIVGLQMRPHVIREVGKVAFITGVGQVVFTSLAGFFIAHYIFNFSFLAASYISVAFSFSSTIIILKLLSDKRHLEKLYGKIAIGFLLVQDVIAILILVVVSSLHGSEDAAKTIFAVSLRVWALAAALIIASKYVLPRFSSFFAKSQELLFLFSVSFGLGLSAVFAFLGFSFEIGALIAGVTLSVSPYSYEMSAKMRPLRDFFITIFFILLGSRMSFGAGEELVMPTIFFSLFILIGNPLILMALMGALGYSKKVGFMAGLTVAQISEFSLVLVSLGVKVGHLNDEIISLTTLVGLITIAVSTYMILYAEKLYRHVEAVLTVFERKRAVIAESPLGEFEVILVGCNRIGDAVAESLKHLDGRLLVVDFDPSVIRKLEKRKVSCLYGDADDSEFLDELPLVNAKMIVSTISDYETNLFLMRRARESNQNAIVIVTSHTLPEAAELYKEGASYVIMPYFLGGKHAGAMIKRYGFERDKFDKERKKQLGCLFQKKSA